MKERELSRIRKEGRISKDRVKLSELIERLLEEDKWRNFRNHLKNTLGEIRKIENIQKNRIYNKKIKDE